MKQTRAQSNALGMLQINQQRNDSCISKYNPHALGKSTAVRRLFKADKLMLFRDFVDF